MKPTQRVIAGIWLTLLGASSIARAADGFLAIANPGDASSLAIRFEVPAGGALESVRWFNNDELSHFQIRAVPENALGEPDLGGEEVGIARTVWASEGWSHATLEGTVGSVEGAVYVIWQYPTGGTLSNDGLGGGPGIGYTDGTGPLKTLIGHGDGEWMEIQDRFVTQATAKFVASAPEVLFDGMAKDGSAGSAALPRTREIKTALSHPSQIHSIRRRKSSFR
jgi:hypothetical protein